MKKSTAIITALALSAITATSLVACGGGNEDNEPIDPNDKSALVMEAEYVNLTDPLVVGKAESAEATGLKLIFGMGYDEGEVKASNGYYLYQTFSDSFAINFVFNSSMETTARISVALGLSIDSGALQSATFSQQNFSIKLNGDPFSYSLLAKNTDDPVEPVIKEVTVSTSAKIKKGENTITLKVETNSDFNGQNLGPIIDFVKVRANDKNAELSWTPHTDNIAE